MGLVMYSHRANKLDINRLNTTIRLVEYLMRETRYLGLRAGYCIGDI